VWCKIYVDSIDHFVIGICYQSQDAVENELCEMFEGIKKACEANRSVLIMGDFNYPQSNCNTLRQFEGREQWL